MKLSDILKSKQGQRKEAILPIEKTEIPLQKDPSLDDKLSSTIVQKLSPLPYAPTPIAPPSETSAEVDPLVFEAQIRKDLEAEAAKKYEEQVALFKAEEERVYQEKLKEMSKQLADREKRAAEQERKFDEQVKGLEERLSQANKAEMMHKLEEVKAQGERELLRRQAEMESKLAGLSKALEEKQSLLDRKEALFEDEKEKLSFVQSQKKDEPIELKKPLEEKKFELSDVTQRREQYKDVQKLNETNQEFLDLYGQVVREGLSLFEKITRGENVSLEALNVLIARIVEINRNGNEMIEVAQQPYPGDSSYFYHASNCMILALTLGIDLKMSDEVLRDLGHASLFHDIALFHIREDLDYPKQLHDGMHKEITNHAQRGAEIVVSHLSEAAREGIAQHHETCNGSGYPEALKEDDICLFSKIINVVDSFEAMTHERPYRKKPLSINAAMKQIVETGRGVYDKVVLKTLMGRIGLYPVGSLVELNNKQVARVLRQNCRNPLSPVVQVEFDELGHKLRKKKVLDLCEVKLIHIQGVLEEIESYQARRLVGHEHKATPIIVSIIWTLIPWIITLSAFGISVYIILKI